MHIFFVVIVFLLSISTLLINIYEILRRRDQYHLLSKSDKNILYLNTGASATISFITGIMLLYRHSKKQYSEGNSFGFG
jgi:uncharacterized BrkB/YihY/UPF0761 family membrane protein